MKALNELSIAEARERLDQGAVSSVALTEACLGQIQSLDGALHAFLEVWPDEALQEAKRSDERRSRGLRLGEFDGIPLAVKDNMLVQGRHCSAGSKILENYVATNDATVVAKLKTQGAVFLGRTNMDEFAMGSSTENSAYGPTKHPRDPARVPGGSSGGSAVAVAANMCLGALGSDTGGSIRQPASLCGIVGLKPTYGRVSRSGLIAMASSFDQIGPLAKSVEDAARLFEAIQGADVLDQTTANVEAFQASGAVVRRQGLEGVRVGMPRQAWGKGMTDEVRTRVRAAVDVLTSLGAEVVDVDLPYADEALAVYYVLMPCEVSANLARFDGMRYGVRAQASTLLETYLQSRASGLGREVRRRILLGTYALSRGYYDAYYRQAKRVQTLIQNAYASAFEHVDVLVSPTSPSTAFKLGEKTSDPLAMYLEDLFTVGANVAGLPAVSVPCGDASGLPVGLHLTGRMFDEATLLGVARAYEGARG
ncbi:glutaminyl-tRNA synthase (glutamine-hydrolyzing) subunit A [Candidatus Uhrbacteria bacterium RIFCSPHIGHO2_12_FULL_60_25]|uniref:Glutamyl-tRNA(Gln) amidotransferase subunit A n=1 Tax=Candidatus Uhrbacteria bacterium RIFCSPHIGHO2_12_FULL_60_25 TaxID=1802399 RepID=A0A1F7UL94_9BACT|nr:MAG: glutaminyl-tRNA synthase (glutamine-hydrolyzing) subunit A [Candidatus Uhrbacteria bacterium RIFCSPHIGHO2_12_FULL_60_25]